MKRELIDGNIEWLGKIPTNWIVQPLKRVINERNELNKSEKETFLLSLTIQDGIIPYSEKNGGGNKAKEDISKYKIVKKNDIVINSMNVVVGASGISKYDGLVSPVYYVFSETNKSCGRFYNYLFLNQTFENHLFGLGNGILVKINEDNGKMNTIRKKIPIDKLRNEFVPVPPLEEQIKISNYLDNKVSLINETIENNKKEIELLEEYKVSFIDKEIFFEKNNNIKLKYLVKVRNEKGISKTSNEFISLENIESRTGNHVITETDYSNCSGKIFKKGDLLINKLRPYLAKSYLAEFDGVCTGEIEVISGFWGNIDYLKYYTLSSKYIDLVNSSTYGTKMPRANWNFIKNMLIPNISVEKQTNVVNNINNINDKINQVIQYRKQIIEKLEEYKKSLIYEAVTGKIEV